MSQLYVEVYNLTSEEAQVPVKSAVCLFVLSYLQNPPDVALTLVETEPQDLFLKVRVKHLHFHTISHSNLPSAVGDCYLPVFTTAGCASYVAGLCAVLRQVVKYSGEEWRQLLGFREGCLFACAEVSLWTKFCEIDVVETVNNVLSREKEYLQDVDIPEHLVRFEEHLKQPVRMHNVDKLRKQINRDQVDHDFAEGYSMSLADLIIVPCVRVILQAVNGPKLCHHLPFVLKWFRLVIGQELVEEALKIISDIPSQVSQVLGDYVVPSTASHSLYKSDPKRYKPRLKQFTRQEDVEAALRVVEDIDLPWDCDEETFGREVSFDWETIPGEVQPDVPESRLARKRQQLENLTRAVIKVARPGDKIVDFCCGSGHLGIVLAHRLPECHVVLLDNKEESLARAQSRVRQLALHNVTVVQCNLDYFKGSFQIGVSLHACGVASDLVIQSCLLQNAAFVVCPCCYGSLQANHMVTYPRSSALSPLTPHQYLVLGHCADQTHKQLYTKSAQGERCMAIVDRDRCQLAKERGYSVSLSKLDPPSCSPKNNLLVGIPHVLTVL